MKLHHQIYFDHVSPTDSALSAVIIIPGLFGSCGNWRGFAKELSRQVPVIVLDQRNHGLSPHSKENSYFDLADDLKELITQLGLERISVCGHSMGGKTAMVFALNFPSLLDKLIVLDIAPVEYDHSHAKILQGMMGIDLKSVSSRSQVDQELSQAIPDKATRMFILLSLAKNENGYFWRLNTQALYENLDLIVGFPSDELSQFIYTGESLFIRGGKSHYVEEQAELEIKRFFPASTLETVSDAGHWLHIDNQQEVLERVLLFLKKSKK
ncbi:MAG: alpha/beta fold hydrolase [Gammaproteobacteria bacterium]|nr:alpha/beta fold hydrolase [Gammaproteobacteria bacterium]